MFVIPQDIEQRIDTLTEDLRACYVVIGALRNKPITDSEMALYREFSGWMARVLVMKGWHEGMPISPLCPSGNLCFDPEPHAKCQTW